LASALKYDGVINYVKVPLKDWESEKVNVGNIRGYASSFWKSYKKGGVTDDLEKELRKLQRDLNSTRLSVYKEGDNSAEEMARQAERAAKLARFDEVLRLLRESDAKFAKGGKIEYIHKHNDRDNLYYKRYNGAIGSFAWLSEKKYNEGIIYPFDDFDMQYYSHLKLKPNEVLLRYRTDRMIGDVKYIVKFNLEKSLIYFMDTDKMSDDDDKNIIFQGRGIPIEYMVLDWDKLNASQQANINYAKGGEIVKERNGKLYREEWAGSNRWLEVDSQFKMTKDEHEAKAFQENLNGNYESRDNHKHIAATLSGEPIQLQEHHNRYMAKGGMTNLVGNSPVKKYPIDKSNIDIVE